MRDSPKVDIELQALDLISSILPWDKEISHSGSASSTTGTCIPDHFTFI